MRKIIIWVLKIVIAVILLQTLSFKFTAHPQSVYIFSKIGLEPYGRIGIGIMELIAVILLFIPKTTWLGAGLSAGLMAGALFFHLTSLGIEVDGDIFLFLYALIAFVASILLLLFYYKFILSLLKNLLHKNA